MKTQTQVTATGDRTMDGLTALIGVLMILLVLNAAVVAWGHDSRPSITDDHNR